MSYDQKDTSTHDGLPIEVYRFVGPFGEYRYTSYAIPITVAGLLYMPLPITRTSIETGSIVDTIQTMDFVIPVTSALAKAYAFMASPKELRVEVRRVHEGDDYSTQFSVEHIGEGLGTSNAGKWTTIKTGSVLQSKLSGNLSTVYYQRVCNHNLYDERCKVVRAAFTSTATVVKVQGQIITVNNDGVADNILNAGEILNTRTGEVQAIISNLANVIRAGYRFIDIRVGDVVELTQGCNHARLGDCKTKFNNVPNYGGFDFIPITNPFADLNKGNIAAVVTTVKRDRTKDIGFPPNSASYS